MVIYKIYKIYKYRKIPVQSPPPVYLVYDVYKIEATVPRRHLLSFAAPQQPKNAITAMIAPTTMMMMDPVTYFTEERST